MKARPWRRAIIALALKVGRLPHELLAATDSRELAELFAYFKLEQEDEEEQSAEDQEASWRRLLSKPIDA